MVYASYFYPTLNSPVLALRSTCVAHVVWHHFSRIFYILPYIMWLVTMSSDVTNVWQHDLVTLSLILVLKIEDRKENQKKNENRKAKENKLSPLFSFLTLGIFFILFQSLYTVRCSLHLIIQDLIRSLRSPNKLLYIIWKSRRQVGTTFNFSLCTVSL